MRERPAIERLKHWAWSLKRDVLALWLAARDPRTPWYAKVVAGAVAAYALSPIDLIPDVVPILGYLDDLIIVALGIALAVRLIPPPLLDTFRSEAASRHSRPKSTVAAVIILSFWLVVSVALVWWTASALN